MDLLSYFRVLRRRWVLIVLCVVVGGALGAASTMFDKAPAKTRTYYKATNTQIFDNSSSSSVPSSVNNLDQIAILVTTGDVPNLVAKALSSSEPGRQLAESIVTTTNGVTSTIDVTAVGATPKEAVALADEFAKQIGVSLTARDLARYNQTQQTLNSQLDDLKNQANAFFVQLQKTPKIPDFDTVQKQYDATQNQYYSVYGNLQQLTTAGPPQSRLSTLEAAEAIPIGQSEYRTRLSLGELGQNHLQAGGTGATSPAVLTAGSSSSLFEGRTSRGILGALVGFLVGVGLAMVADKLDHRIRTRQETEDAFGLPVLAEVPRFSRTQSREAQVVAHTEPRSRVAEAYRAVRTSLLFQQASLGTGRASLSGEEIFEPRPDGPASPLVVMVTSASPREGKTTTTANLAAVFAEAGSSVLVINCDFRRPTIHRRFGLEDVPRRVQDTEIRNLKIVTNVLGDPNANPAQVVAAQRQAIAAARTRFDVIVLDTAPMLTANDAIEAVGSTDLVLLVARNEMTTTDKARRSMEILTRLEAPLGGVVLVATDDAPSDYYYYYQRGRRSRGDGDTVAAAVGNGNGNGQANGNGNGNGMVDGSTRTEMFPSASPPDAPPG